MTSIIFQYKTHNVLTLLIATLLMLISSHLPLHAGTSQGFYNMDAIKDPGSLAVKLQDTRAAVSKSIAGELSVDTQQLLSEYDGISSPSVDLQKALISDLNLLLQTGSLYDAELFADVELSQQTQALIAEDPKNGKALMRLKRSLLADAYPYELASLSEQQPSQHAKRIEVCRENLRQIKIARENYRTSNADADPQWLSELVPQYLEQSVLICPADTTAGKPGVLTEDAVDPTLPCSYLYELRAPEKTGQEMLSAQEGDMTPIVRCEHHLLNLSVGGKLYRNGPQRTIYNSNETEISMLAAFVRDLREQHGEKFLETQEVREELKQATEELFLEKVVPKLLSELKKEVYGQITAQLGTDILKTQMGLDILRQALVQVMDAVEEQLQAQLEEQLGSEFFETQEGKDVLQQLSELVAQ